MKLRLIVWVCALLGTMALHSTPVSAAPSGADRDRARALMDEGDALVEKKNYADALAKYREAHLIMRVTTTGIEVARTLAALGRLVEAKRAAHEAAGIPPEPGEPQAFSTARKDAAALARELDVRVPQLTITVSGVESGAKIELSIDGKAVPSPDTEQPQDLDPGEHAVVGEAGGKSATAKVNLKEGERQTLTLSFNSEKPSTVQPVTPRDQPTSPSSTPTLGYVIGGIGLAGLAVAGVTSVIFYKNHQDIKDACPQKNQCTDEGIDKIDKQKSLGTINAIAFAVGAIGTGVGAYLILSNRSQKEQTSMKASWVPGHATLSLQRSF